MRSVVIQTDGTWTCPNPFCQARNAESTVYGVPEVGEVLVCDECRDRAVVKSIEKESF